MQKAMLSLVFIGTIGPNAYALNRAMTDAQVQDFVAVSHQTMRVLNHYIVESGTGATAIGDPRDDVENHVRTRKFAPERCSPCAR